MKDFLPYLISILMPVVSAGVAFLVAYLKARTIEVKVNAVEEALKKTDDEYYVLCPTCGTRISLSKVKIYLAERTEEVVSE